MKRRIGLQGFFMFLSLAVVVFLPRLVFARWSKEGMDEFLDALGIVLIACGFLLRVSARGYKQEHSGQGVKLVTEGPYRLVRNPMYLGTLLIGTGIISILFALWTLPLFLAVYLLIYIPQLRSENSVLASRFKREYEDYRLRTPLYLPKFWHWFKAARYLPLKFSWVRNELSSMIAVFSAVLLIEVIEDLRCFGPKELWKEPLELILIILIVCLALVLAVTKKWKGDKIWARD